MKFKTGQKYERYALDTLGMIVISAICSFPEYDEKDAIASIKDHAELIEYRIEKVVPFFLKVSHLGDFHRIYGWMSKRRFKHTIEYGKNLDVFVQNVLKYIRIERRRKKGV